jgi:hypothetical protein
MDSIADTRTTAVITRVIPITAATIMADTRTDTAIIHTVITTTTTAPVTRTTTCREAAVALLPCRSR